MIGYVMEVFEPAPAAALLSGTFTRGFQTPTDCAM